jgi:hypothetical protein
MSVKFLAQGNKDLPLMGFEPMRLATIKITSPTCLTLVHATTNVEVLYMVLLFPKEYTSNHYRYSL